ncbi:tol-pal system YbgF family protein [Prosthecobacter sp.]|uniref:tol-pal system YbgF family protein n=1 Tax=Prosthecobacter sp. TaxID=1965333 RepID=UPI003784B842
MNTALVIRICVVALVLLVIALLWHFVKDAGDGMKLVFVILLGLAGGLLAVKYLIPWLGDVMGEAVFSSGEKVEQDHMTKAAARIAQGDYQGAIEHYEKMLEDKPDDPFPVAEIAKVYAERMHDPQAALKALEDHLQSKDWPVDDAAFIMFRIADVHLTQRHDFETARDMLEQIIGNFPNTRHSANAHHRMSELEQMQYKLLMEQRAKAGASGATKA